MTCQNEPPSPETKSTFELAKENTIQKHTGVNVTTGEGIVPTANVTSNVTGILAAGEVLSVRMLVASQGAREK